MRAYRARQIANEMGYETETQKFIRKLGEAQRKHRGAGSRADFNRRREDIDYGAERLAETAEDRAAGWEQ